MEEEEEHRGSGYRGTVGECRAGFRSTGGPGETGWGPGFCKRRGEHHPILTHKVGIRTTLEVAGSRGSMRETGGAV